MLTQLTLNLPFGSVVFCFDSLVVLFQGLISELARYHLRWYAWVQGSSPWRYTTYSSCEVVANLKQLISVLSAATV